MERAVFPGGVWVEPVPASAGREVTICYHGLLSQCGADKIWMRSGYSQGRSWEDIYDHPMEKTEGGWVKKIKLEKPGTFNFCFKDSANNWDNNNGLNWSFTVQ